MFKLAFGDYVGIAGIVLAIILIVLDKAGKLKGPILLVLLGVAAIMTLPLVLGNSWVGGAPSGMLKFSRGMVIFFVVGVAYSVLAIWISGGPENFSSEFPERQIQTPPVEAKSQLSSVPTQPSKPSEPSEHVPSGTIRSSKSPSSKLLGFPTSGFHEKVGTITIFLGGVASQFQISDLQKGPRELIPGFEIYLKENTLHYHVKIWGGLEVNDNEFSAGSMLWDSNSSTNAFEVVNEHQVPLFQLIRKSPSKLAVYGIFPVQGGFQIMTEGQTTPVKDYDPHRSLASNLKPIFRYPAWKYPGQYAE